MSCLSINEPDCLINNYYVSGIQLLDFFKDFTIGFCHEMNAGINEDERLSVGCLLTEHLMPLMEDSFYLESQVLQFLSELSHLNKPALTEVVFRVYQLCFDDEYLKKWTAKLMNSCCKKLI